MARRRTGRAGGGERGSASVELVGVLPFLVVAVLVAAQLGVAGAALWSAAIASRAGARAELVGGDGAGAARAALPAALSDGAEVEAGEGVAVRVRVPALVPGFPDLSVGTRSGLESPKR